MKKIIVPLHKLILGKMKEYKWGYVAQNGEFAVAPKFDGASDFHDGLAAVKIDWSRGYIDRSGSYVIEPKFEDAGDFTDGIAKVKIDGEERFINRKGEFVEPPFPETSSIQFDSGYQPHFHFHDGLIRFIENEKFGYKNREGEVVIKPTFVEASDFSEGLACVKKGKSASWGYIDKSGKYVIPAQFKQAHSFHEGLAAVLISVTPE